jgi:tetratricopeptide (TPR) repeat protein
MALVERLKRWRDVARLRKQVRANPSPTTYAELAERFVALSEPDEAVLVADEGLSLYPHADRLAHVRLFVKKSRLTGQIRKLREDLQRRPTPLAFSQLAQLYRELGSHDEALAIAAQCAERFPLSESAYLMQGEIRMDRFRRDLIAKDAVIAESALRQVLRLNGHNVTAHLRLAEVYHVVGMRAACAAHLREVLLLTPDARDVEEFLAADDAAGAGAAPEDAFEDLAGKVQSASAFTGDPERFPSPKTGDEAPTAGSNTALDAPALCTAMAAFADHDGVRNAVLLDHDGKVVADHASADAIAKNHFAELIAEVRDAADDAARRMDTGSLVRADIEGPGMNLVVTRVRGLTIGVHYAEPMRSDLAWEIVQDFMARQLTAGREESDA